MTAAPESPSVPSQGDLFSLLDADNVKTVEETKALILENLHSSRDPGLLNSMVEFYLKTRSPACLQILSGIQEARAQALFEKMNECLKHRPTRLDTLTLLGHIVRKQPSWLYKIIKTPLFESLLKFMKSDTDVVVLTSGILTLTTLLPLVPASIGHCLQHLFDIFTRLSSFRARRQGNAPEVYLLHLHVAVYMFFHRLYAMYPNNFLVYLRTLNNEPSKQSLFQNTIKPMLEHVRLHPCIITETIHTETEKHRWRKKETHDIVIECMKLSLDPIDRIQEKGTFMSSSTSRHSCQELFADKSISSIFTASCDSHGPETGRLKERRMSDSATQTGKSLQSGDSGTDSCNSPVVSSDEIAAGWSPSKVCQLSTPPSSQMSPSTSNPDLLSSLTIHSHCSTPAAMYTPGQSPTTSLGGDVAYHHGYSSSPSVSVGKGRGAVLGGTPSGRGTPVKGAKASSHEGQLTKALFSDLVQHKHESAPAAIEVHQTSTPKELEPIKSKEDNKVESPVEGATYKNITSSKSVLSTFEAHGEETRDNFLKSSTEQFDRSSFNISQKEDYRDFSDSGQEVFALEFSDHKSFESQQDGFNVRTDLLPDSPTPVLTPVAGHSLDTVTLVNSPSSSKSIAENAGVSTEPVESQDSMQSHHESDGSVHSGDLSTEPVESQDSMQSHHESDGSVHSRDYHDQEASTNVEHGDEGPQVSNSETSLVSDDVSLDSPKFHSTTPDVQQNHPSSCASDLIAAFPQLWPLVRGEHEYSGSSYTAEMDDAGFSRLQQHLLSSGASPVEILDSYLKTGSSVHYGELSRVPLVSQTGTAWTHFGGEPPMDEVELLKGQVKLLHNQLLFERHKCDLHAIRNRRLIGKTFKAVQYQEELQATKDQLRLQEDKMRELTDALNKQEEDSRRFKAITSSWENHQRIRLRDYLNENAQLKYNEKELLMKLETQQKEFDTKQTEVQQLRARIFTLENELDRLKVQATEKEQLSKQVSQLVKELLIMGELNQQQKDMIKKLTFAEGQNPESNMQLHGCHRELGVAKQTLKKQKAELEALTSKLTDMETLVSNKDIEIREMKKFTEGLKGTYVGKIQSLEEKYNAQKKITQALESYILDLQAVDSARREKMEQEKMPPDP